MRRPGRKRQTQWLAFAQQMTLADHLVERARGASARPAEHAGSVVANRSVADNIGPSGRNKTKEPGRQRGIGLELGEAQHRHLAEAVVDSMLTGRLAAKPILMLRNWRRHPWDLASTNSRPSAAVPSLSSKCLSRSCPAKRAAGLAPKAEPIFFHGDLIEFGIVTPQLVPVADQQLLVGFS